MRIVQLILSIAFFAIPAIAACLPEGIKQNDVVGHKTVTMRGGGTQVQKITVKQTLKNLGSRCVKGKLVDRRGREIRFVRIRGCWGNPPADYLEILAQQTREIEALKKRYTVIEMTCNPGGVPPWSIV